MKDLRGTASDKITLTIVSAIGYGVLVLGILIFTRFMIRDMQYANFEKEQAKYNSSLELNKKVKMNYGNILLNIRKCTIVDNFFIISTTFENNGNEHKSVISDIYVLDENGIALKENDNGYGVPKEFNSILFDDVSLEPGEKQEQSIVFNLDHSFKELNIKVGNETINIKGLEYKQIELPQNYDSSNKFMVILYVGSFAIIFFNIKRTKGFTYKQQRNSIILSIFLICVGPFSLIVYFLGKNNRLIDAANEQLINNLTETNVKEYIESIKKCRIPNNPQMWNRLKAIFSSVNDCDNISSDVKKELMNTLIAKGVYINNKKINLSEDEIKRKKKESGEKGEQVVQYALKWLNSEYKVLHNARIKHNIDGQEIDSIVVGPKGVFHIETKNHGGENGCNISIKENGEWIREDKYRTSTIENPNFQLLRHDRVLTDCIKSKFSHKNIPVVGLIVLSNKNTLVSGIENSKAPVIKVENLVDFIENHNSTETLSHEEISSIYSALQY